MALYAPFRRKIEFKCNLGYVWYEALSQKSNKTKRPSFAHTISIPAKLVLELGLSDSMVELKIRGGSIVIKKLV